MNILEKIVDKTKTRVLNLDIEKLKKAAKNADFEPEFKNALSGDEFKIIAEIKKASPSKGIIEKDFRPEITARDYKIADVDCISVLTEPYFFMGDNSYVKKVKEISKKPILRKDFIIDKAQIYESKAIGSDCILLICAILDLKTLREFQNIANDTGLDTLVEAHNEAEIEMALKINAPLIGVNNRNLKNFEVDFNNTFKLRKLVPEDKIFIAESGIKTREDVELLIKNRVSGALIGETFMRAADKVSEIKKLKGIQN